MDFDLIWGVARVLIGCALVWETSRRWSPVLSSQGVGVERGLAVGLLAFWLVITVVAGLGASHALGAGSMLIVTFALFSASLVLRRERPTPLLPPVGPERLALLWPMLMVVPILFWDIGWRLPAPPTDWDGLTYHLYLPVRWLQAGQLLHVPTVFGDPAAAFAPQNGALIYTWWIALLGGDAHTNVVNVLPAAMLALAIVGLAARCGLGRENAMLAGIAIFWVGPMRSAIYEARVDVLMLAFWATSLFFITHGLDSKRSIPWIAAGLATGLAAGTKVVGLSLIGPQAVFFGLLLLVRREFLAFLGFLAACVAGGGWWFILDIVQFGNPLFPLDTRIAGFTLFHGAIPFSALAGQFHTSLPDLIGRVLPHFFGWAAICLMFAGFFGLVVVAFGASAQRPVRLLVAAIALYWACFYFFSMPHNTETRFVLPVVVLALVGWAWLIEPLERRSVWWVGGAWALTFAILCFDVERLPQWRATMLSPLEAGVPMLVWIPLGVVTISGLGIAAAVRAPSRVRVAGGVGLLGLSIALGFGQFESIEHRELHHRKSRFREWAPAIRALDHVDPGHDAIVAYSGLNLPYTLTGPHLTRSVRYVNTHGGLDDGFYDFWHRSQTLAHNQKPGLYRGQGRDDYDLWMRNLEVAEIDWLVVFRLHPQERYILADKEGFPIERGWARNHPRRFEMVASGPAFELYRLGRFR